MATLLWPGKEFRISHQEVHSAPPFPDLPFFALLTPPPPFQMIKGVRIGGVGKTLTFLDTLVIPIIENTPDEEDLTDSMAQAMEDYPDAPAVLVRRHGVYVWGECVRASAGRSHSLASSTFAPFASFGRPLTLRCYMFRRRRLSSGPDWEKAKTQTECLDYLFEVSPSRPPGTPLSSSLASFTFVAETGPRRSYHRSPSR